MDARVAKEIARSIRTIASAVAGAAVRAELLQVAPDRLAQQVELVKEERLGKSLREALTAMRGGNLHQLAHVRRRRVSGEGELGHAVEQRTEVIQSIIARQLDPRFLGRQLVEVRENPERLSLNGLP